jgi:hypothetical protein
MILKDPKNYNSSWDWCVDHSNYHFDNTRQDQEGEWYTQLGRFQGNWTEELEALGKQTHPITWATRKYYGDNDNTASPMLQQEENDLINTGFGVDLQLTNINDRLTEYPTLLAIADYFGLEDPKRRVHWQQPGQMFNLHIDKLWERDLDNPERIVRITVMLTDWQPGQFYLYGTATYSHWRAGEAHIFDWPNVPHATANASHVARPTLQMTGLKTDRTREILESASSERVFQI